MDNDESSLKIVILTLVFAIGFCFCSWLYYHGFYTGYYQAYSDYKLGKIDNPNNERFKQRFEKR